MNESDYIKCHILKMDGTVKDCDISSDRFPFDYAKYLYNGELYFKERIKDGKIDNKIIYKEYFDRLVNSQENNNQRKTIWNGSKMTKCKVCGADIAKSAKTCQHCGAALNRNNQIGQVLAVIFIFLIAISCWYVIKSTSGVNSGTQTAEYAATSNDAPATPVYEDDYIKASFIKVYEENAVQGAFYLQLQVENKSSDNITVSLSQASVNGTSTTIMSGVPMEIRPGNSSEQPFVIFTNNLDIASMNDVKDIEFSFYLMGDSANTIEETDIVTLSF